MALSKHYIPFKTEAEYWQIAQAIQHKVEGQKSLTYYERGFFCSGQKFEYLRHHKICDEEFYSRAHLELNTPENAKDDPRYREIMKFYGKKIAPLTAFSAEADQAFSLLIDHPELGVCSLMREAVLHI